MRFKTQLLITLLILLISLAACTPAQESPPPLSLTPHTTATPLPFAPLTWTVTPTDLPQPSATPTLTPSPHPPTPTLTDLPVKPTDTAIQSVQITILYDNYLWDQRLSVDWGFAALLEAGPHTLLFDTGGNANIFLQNLETLEIDPKSIEAVVISHVHGDHIGGLLAFLAQADHPTVYLPDSFPSSLKERVAQEAELVEVSGPTTIFPGITIIGPLSAGSLEEQGLLIDLGDDVVILTGCAHPGVTFMVQSGLDTLAAQQDGVRKPVALLVGGFHLLEASQRQVEAVIARLQELGVRQVVPTHCTGDSAITTFARIFGDNYIPGGAGQVIKLP